MRYVALNIITSEYLYIRDKIPMWWYEKDHAISWLIRHEKLVQEEKGFYEIVAMTEKTWLSFVPEKDKPRC